MLLLGRPTKVSVKVKYIDRNVHELDNRHRSFTITTDPKQIFRTAARKRYVLVYRRRNIQNNFLLNIFGFIRNNPGIFRQSAILIGNNETGL